MRFFPLPRTALAGLLALPLLVGCQDELPTATGADFFPGGARPVTVELILSPDELVLSDTVYRGFSSAHASGFLLVANAFENALQANAVARLAGFPDSVTYNAGGSSVTTADFTYGGGRVITVVGPLASTNVTTRLRLYALDQPFDTAGLSWTSAGGTPPVPWRTPGGTRGALLAEATWVPGDTVARDTVSFELDSLQVASLARPDHPGLLVTSETPGTRLQLSWLSLQTRVRPAALPDSAVTQTIGALSQSFVYTPEIPPAVGALRAGGITGDRTVLTLRLAHQVPACANPATTPNCPTVPLSSVTINQASLLLQPVPTPGGLRPLQAPVLRIRRVLEPELGRFAPLGQLIYTDTITPGFFAPGGGELALDVTRAVTLLSAEGLQETSVAILTEPEGAQFGYLYFADRPRLRVIYTLPLRPTFP